MFPRQSDPDTNDDARQKTDEETKPGRVAHRALTQVENPRRFIFVHIRHSQSCRPECKQTKCFPEQDSSANGLARETADAIGDAANLELTAARCLSHHALRQNELHRFRQRFF